MRGDGDREGEIDREIEEMIEGGEREGEVVGEKRKIEAIS